MTGDCHVRFGERLEGKFLRPTQLPSNQYKIPATGKLPSYPVTAAEYCAFLQENASDESCWLYSGFYDSAFMSTSEDFLPNRQACIYRSGWSPNYHYSVIPGHENDIIDGLQYQKLQDSFIQWRSSPSVKDVCDYLNDKITGDDAAAAAIEANYNGSSYICGIDFKNSWWSSNVDQVFKHADDIAANINKASLADGSTGLPPAWGFYFSKGQITFQAVASSCQAGYNPSLTFVRPDAWGDISVAGHPIAPMSGEL